MAFQTIRDALPRVLGNLGANQEKLLAMDALEQELNGVAAPAKIIAFQGNCIYVEVDSSAQIQELDMHRPNFLSFMRRKLPEIGSQARLEIRFCLKGMARPRAQGALRRPAAKKRVSGYTSYKRS